MSTTEVSTEQTLKNFIAVNEESTYMLDITSKQGFWLSRAVEDDRIVVRHSKPMFGTFPGPSAPKYFVWRRCLNHKGEHIASEYLFPDGEWRPRIEVYGGKSETGKVEGFYPSMEAAEASLQAKLERDAGEAIAHATQQPVMSEQPPPLAA